MNYFKLLKFKFTSPVRIGTPSGTGLDEVQPLFKADTIFSAFCHAMNDISDSTASVKSYLEEFKEKPKFLISDMLPFINSQLCFPRPYCYIHHSSDSNNKKEDNLSDKKKLKSIKYFTLHNLRKYLNGEECDFKNEETINEYTEEFISFKASIFRNYSCENNEIKLENNLYAVNSISYRSFNKHDTNKKQIFSPYLIVQYVDEKEYKTFTDALKYLSETYSGLGGKRSVGYGQFKFTELTENEYGSSEIKSVLKNSNGDKKLNILLNAARPSKDESKEALNENNLKGYQIIEKKGFVHSPYWKKEPIKKSPCFLFDSGSVFKKRFQGELIDITPEAFPHRVYRYGYSMFIGVN